jgi:hypothetical protein
MTICWAISPNSPGILSFDEPLTLLFASYLETSIMWIRRPARRRLEPADRWSS